MAEEGETIVELSEKDVRVPKNAEVEKSVEGENAIDVFVNQRRFDYSDRRTPNPIQVLTDLIDYVGADIKAVRDNKTIPTKEKGDKLQDLSTIQNTAVNIITSEASEVDLQQAREYIVGQIENEQHMPEDISHMFDSFLQILPDTTPDFEKAPLQEKEVINNQERFPPYTYNANRTTQTLDDLAPAA